jgi:hypothetical protein
MSNLRNSHLELPRARKLPGEFFLWGCLKAHGRDAPKNSLINATGQVSEYLPCPPRFVGFRAVCESLCQRKVEMSGERVVEDLIWLEM